ncbi:hypothetical protein V8G54_036266 [Vigna mungo]|uniref:Uncharacterized protein n=1 Tax=Vigna mungo TaxID=3915 RepID=A0AAQ3MGS7_VIGMU
MVIDPPVWRTPPLSEDRLFRAIAHFAWYCGEFQCSSHYNKNTYYRRFITDGLEAFGNISVKLNTEGFCPSFDATVRRREFGCVDADGGSLLGGTLPFLTLYSKQFVGLKREVVALRWFEAVAIADAVGGGVVAGLRLGEVVLVRRLGLGLGRGCFCRRCQGEGEGRMFAVESRRRGPPLCCLRSTQRRFTQQSKQKVVVGVGLEVKLVTKNGEGQCQLQQCVCDWVLVLVLVYATAFQTARRWFLLCVEKWRALAKMESVLPFMKECLWLQKSKDSKAKAGQLRQQGGYHGRVVALDQMEQSKQLHDATSFLA